MKDQLLLPVTSAQGCLRQGKALPSCQARRDLPTDGGSQHSERDKELIHSTCWETARCSVKQAAEKAARRAPALRRGPGS